MKSRLKCICLDCQEEKQLYWYEQWGKEKPIRYRLYLCRECINYIELHTRPSWHTQRKADLYARKYRWRRGGAKRWLKKNGLDGCSLERANCFTKSIQALKNYLLSSLKRKPFSKKERRHYEPIPRNQTR